MQRLDLQFYAFFMLTLCGATLGLLFDLLRVARGHYRPNRWVAAAADLLFWSVATLTLSGALFYGNWGELRFYVAIALLLGVGLYYWLASALVKGLIHLIFAVLAWLVNLLATLLLRLVWAPLLFIAELIWATVLTLWGWVWELAELLWHLVGHLLWRPLRGPYRWLKLRYLLGKRRVKRWLRRLLLGPPRPRRR